MYVQMSIYSHTQHDFPVEPKIDVSILFFDELDTWDYTM